MKIVQNCWDQIDTYNCQYGAHIFAKSTARIYVNQWLAPSKELHGLFYRKNDEGYVGHCVLVFEGIKTFDFSVTIVHKDREGKPFWDDPITSHYEGSATDGLTKYALEGSLHGFSSSVSISIEAQKFELHILGKDEPARES
jgi:hypothetical protein